MKWVFKALITATLFFLNTVSAEIQSATPVPLDFSRQVIGYTSPTNIILSNTGSSVMTLNGLWTRSVPHFATDWAPQTGPGKSYWRVVNDAYQYEANGASGEGVAFYNDGSMAHYSVQVDISQSMPSDNGYCGLVTRATKDLNMVSGGGHGYHFALCPSYSGTGGFAILRFDGQLIRKLCDWTWTPVVKNGTQTNRLLVSMTGDQLSFFINGHLVFTCTDTYFTGTGYVGLEGRSSSGQPRIYTYSNLVFDAPLPPDGYITEDTLVGAWQVATAEASLTNSVAREAFIAPPPLAQRVARTTIQMGIQGEKPGTASLDETPFPLTSPTLPLFLGARESISIPIAFEPQALGSTRFALTFTTQPANATDISTNRVEFMGRGVWDWLTIDGEDNAALSGHPGGTFAPESFTRTVTNDGARDYAFTVQTPAWLSAEPASGVLAVGAKQTLTFRPNATTATLSAGHYTGLVTITNTTLSVGQDFTTALNVYVSPTIEIAPQTFVITNAVGQVQSRTFTISNAAQADDTLTARAAAYETGRTLENSSLAAEALAEREAILQPTRPKEVYVADDFKEGELLVRFDTALTRSAATSTRANVLSILNGQIIKTYSLVPGLVLIKTPRISKTTTRGTLRTTLQSIQNMTGVRYAELNARRRINRTPTDPLYDQLWGMNNTGQWGYDGIQGTPGADISAENAWDLSTGSRSVVIGVIDTGVDYTHPDLVDNIWTNPGEIPGNEIDDDHNGYVDDVHGWDAISEDGDPMDQHNHGTHCAGTIGAVANNDIGVAGVCWDVKIMPLRFLDASGYGDDSDAVECMEYAAKMGVRILSNSWGGGAPSQATRDAIAALGRQDILFVVAAGNESTDNDAIPNYPASYDCDNILAVLNSDRRDERHYSSCYGMKSVDIAAPGSSILSTVIGGGYESYTGTSMATPHVAGAAGLLLAYKSDLSALTMKSILMESGDPVATEAGWTLSGKRLNAHRALSGISRWMMLTHDETKNLAPGASHTVNVTFSAIDLQPGIYDGEISIMSNDHDMPVTNITVRMVVESGDLAVLPHDAIIMESKGPELGPFVPGDGALHLRNDSDLPLDWSITQTNDWLQLSSTTGTLEPHTYTDVALTINQTLTRGFPVGAYRSMLAVSNLTATLGQTRMVTLSITNVFASLDTVYVDAARLGDGGSGMNWETAKRTIQAGIDAVNAGGTVWVTNGVYEPITTAKAVTVRSVNGASVTMIDGRGTLRCVTVQDSGEYADKRETCFIGFTIKNGHILGNGGGAAGGYFENCIFRNNFATYGGGACLATLVNCLITDNGLLSNGWGGGICWSKAINCTIVGNSSLNNSESYGSGAGFCNSILQNSIIWNNTNTVGQLNNFVYDSSTSSFNNICNDVIAGTNNKINDPKFNALFQPASDSPAIDAGQSEVAASFLTSLDLAGKTRIISLIDIGCFEFQVAGSAPVTYTGTIVAPTATWSTQTGIASETPWNNNLNSTLVITNTVASAFLNFDTPIVAKSMTFVGNHPLTLLAPFTPAASLYDFSAFYADITVPFPTGASEIRPGLNTILAHAGSSALEIPKGCGVTLRNAWGTTPTGEGSLTLDFLAATNEVPFLLRDYLGPIYLKSGTWTFTAKDKFPIKTTVVIDSANATLRGNAVDTTGYENNPHTNKCLILRNGGTYRLSKRDTLSMPLVLDNGGRIEMESDNLGDGRSLDFFRTASSILATGTETNTIGGVTIGSTRDSGIISLRNPNGLIVHVDDDAILDIWSQWGSTGDYSSGAWTKTGGGTIIFHRKSLSTGAVTIQEGTIKLIGALSSMNNPTLGTGPVTFAHGTTLDLSAMSDPIDIDFRADATNTVYIKLAGRYLYRNLRLLRWYGDPPQCAFAPIASDGYTLEVDNYGLKVGYKITFLDDTETTPLFSSDREYLTQTFNTAPNFASLKNEIRIVGARDGYGKPADTLAAAANLLAVTPTFTANGDITTASVDYTFRIDDFKHDEDDALCFTVGINKGVNDPPHINGTLWLQTSTNFVHWSDIAIPVQPSFRKTGTQATSTPIPFLTPDDGAHAYRILVR